MEGHLQTESAKAPKLTEETTNRDHKHTQTFGVILHHDDTKNLSYQLALKIKVKKVIFRTL